MIKIIFFGTPDIGLKSLDYLNNSDKINVCAVVTQPDKPAGRGNKLQASPIKKYALEHNIPVFQPKSIRKEPEIQEELKKFQAELSGDWDEGNLTERQKRVAEIQKNLETEIAQATSQRLRDKLEDIQESTQKSIGQNI